MAEQYYRNRRSKAERAAAALFNSAEVQPNGHSRKETSSKVARDQRSRPAMDQLLPLRNDEMPCVVLGDRLSRRKDAKGSTGD